MSGVLPPECDGTVKALLRGQVATFEVQGEGFVRRPAPEDALWFELRSETLLLPVASVRAALDGRPARAGAADLRLTGDGQLLLASRCTRVTLAISAVLRLLGDIESKSRRA